MFLGNESKLCDAGLMSFFGGYGYANPSGPTHRLPLSV